MAHTQIRTIVIGAIMMNKHQTKKSGPEYGGIRTAISDGVFKPGAEAHETGNIFASTLLRLRTELLANGVSAENIDKDIIESIRDLGKNPLAIAKDIESAFMRSIEKHRISNEGLGKISQIFKESNFNAMEKPNDIEALKKARSNSFKRMALEGTVDLGASLAESMSLPKMHQFKATQYDKIQIEKASKDCATCVDRDWKLISVNGFNQDMPLWIHSVANNIVDVVDPETMAPVIFPSETVTKYLQEIKDDEFVALPDGFSDAANKLLQILSSGKAPGLFTLKDRTVDEVMIEINGKRIKGRKYTARLKPWGLLKTITWALDSSLLKGLKNETIIAVYAIPQSALKSEHLKPLDSLNAVAVGFEMGGSNSEAKTKTMVKMAE